MLDRPPAVAGSFYPATPEFLREEVERLIAVEDERPAGEVIGLLAPHAGYIFSGPVAGYAYAAIARQPIARVIVIGPSHREPLVSSSLLAEGSYRTPLGRVAVDGEFARLLADADRTIEVGERGHRSTGQHGEHSIEVQLPFLQVALGSEFRFVPIVMGLQEPDTAERLGRAIAAAASKVEGKTLVVASSDLSHYHADEDARNRDRHIVAAVGDFDVNGMWTAVKSGRSEACGTGPIAATMTACREMGATRAVTLDYATSGDVPVGGKDWVVGYLSAVFVKDAES